MRFFTKRLCSISARSFRAASEDPSRLAAQAAPYATSLGCTHLRCSSLQRSMDSSQCSVLLQALTPVEQLKTSGWHILHPIPAIRDKTRSQCSPCSHALATELIWVSPSPSTTPARDPRDPRATSHWCPRLQADTAALTAMPLSWMFQWPAVPSSCKAIVQRHALRQLPKAVMSARSPNMPGSWRDLMTAMEYVPENSGRINVKHQD